VGPVIPVVWDWGVHSSVFWFVGSLTVTAVIVSAGIEIAELHDRREQRKKDKSRH
jgi:hypothetical protein